MLPRLLTLCIFCFIKFSSLLAQDTMLTGQVQAEDTHSPLPYVNIGIKGKNVGTATDEQGNFLLRVPAGFSSDTLTFSAIGYETQIFPIDALTQSQLHAFFLTKKVAALQEVVVHGRRTKVRRIGTTTHNPLLWGNILQEDTYNIVEFAKYIPLAGKPSELLQAHIFLRRPTVDTVTFRLNFYSVSQGLPATRLVEQTILVRTASRDGWLTIDLTRYALTLQTDFYLGFEFLPSQQQHSTAFSYGAQFGGAAITRTSSLGAWNKELGARLTSYITVRQ